MTSLSPGKTMQFVVKISKYCNLRCTYCYEYRELGNRQRMSLDQLRRFFENVAEYTVANSLDYVSFIWHGGEPFLIPIDYYEDILRLQEEIFAGKIQVRNAVQTNLTVLTERHIAFLKEGRLFRGLGISFDVYGDQRVDTQGRLRTDAVLDNLQKLINHGIPFGAIAVLARNTLAHAQDIYRFYDRLGIESRFLPFYMSASGEQVSRHALSHQEITGALKDIFNAWMTSERATPVDPIDEYIDYAVSHMIGGPKRTYDKLDDESVYFVDVDGGTWGVAEAYDAAYQHGNVFEEKLGTVLASPGRQRAVREAGERMNTHCKGCPYFGHCPGYFVGDATPEQQQLLAEAGCPVREMIGHIIGKLEKTGIPNALLPEVGRKIENPALRVGL
jgi:uncharacterized protein